MNETDAMWYLPIEGAEQAGPYTTEQIIEWLWAGKVTETTPILPEGSAESRPLGKVEPFASAIEHAKAAARRRKRRLAIYVAGAAAVVAVVVAVWAMLMDPAAVRQGREFVRTGRYADASRVLAPYVQEHSDHAGATYLLALAKINEYASAKPDSQRDRRRPRARVDVSGEVKQLLRTACRLDKSLEEEARSDLAEVPALVPGDVPDVMVRHLAIARIRFALRWAEPKQLAQELIDLLSARPVEEASRLMEDEPALQMLRWDPSLAGKVVSLALPDDNASRNELALAVDRIRQWIKLQADSVKVLPPPLIRRADRFVEAAKYEHAELLLSASVEIDRDVKSEVARKRLACLARRLESGDASGVVAVLDRTSSESPEMRAGAPQLYFDAAARLRATDKTVAQDALAKGLRLAPNATRSEEIAFLSIELAPQPDDEKLLRYQSFLRDFSESRHRPEVLAILVADAAKAYTGQAHYFRTMARPYLDAGKSAAVELMQQYPNTQGLDRIVFDLGRRLADHERASEALELASEMLEAVPDTPLRLEIEQAIALWRQAKGRGTLPPEFDQLADSVERELKIMTLTVPGTVRVLAEAPDVVHVVEVTKGCTVDRFSSEERELLQQWVSQGGILWGHNDVLSFFDIGFSTVRHHAGRDTTCDPAVDVESCPLLTGCRRVEIQIPSRDPTIVCNLSHEKVIPLLRTSDDTFMSMVSYGDGWVIDRKSIDLDKYDGARFWLNLRLFCLGRDIPGTEQQTVQPPPVEKEPAKSVDRLAEITTAQELSEALTDIGEQQVLWIRLKKGDLSDEAREQLRRWVRSGGVLWLETDAARGFGFRVGHTYSPDRIQGRARVAELDHPVLEGLAPETEVGYVLSSDRFVVIGTAVSFLEQRITPLLGWERSRSSQSVVCAARSEGSGVVIFRPAEIDTSDEQGSRFEENLRSFSFETAQRSLFESAPNDD